MARTVSRQRPAEAKVQVIRLLRVSRMMEREVGDPAFHSPDLQIAGIDAEFDKVYGRGNWEPADVEGNHGQATWADFDKSGGTMDRDGLNAAIEALGTTGVHALGVYNISRWGRIVGDGLKRIEELQQAGAQLISAKEPTDMFSPEGNFMVTLFLALGELQRRQAGVQWSDVIERRAEKQGRHHGVPPNGMRRPVNAATGRRGGDIEADPETSHLVVEAFAQVAAGKSRWEVGHWLVSQGLIGRWMYIDDLLTNRTYLRLHAPECVGTSCARTESHGPCGEVRSFDYEARGRKKIRVGEVWYPGCHEGLIEVDVWDDVQTRVQNSKDFHREVHRRGAPGAGMHELKGVCRCPSCGKVLWVGLVRGRPALRDVTGMQRLGCPGVGVPNPNSVLSVVLADLRKAVVAAGEDAVRRGAGRAPRAVAPRKADLATLQRQRKGIEQRIADVEGMDAAGEYQGNAEMTLANLRSKLAEVNAKEAALLAPAEPTPVIVPPEAAEFLAAYDGLTVERRNDWFREHCVVLVSHRAEGAPWRAPYEDRVEVRWAWKRS